MTLYVTVSLRSTTERVAGVLTSGGTERMNESDVTQKAIGNARNSFVKPKVLVFALWRSETMLIGREFQDSRNHWRLLPLALLLLLFFAPLPTRAQQSEEFDQYKIRVDAFWFYSNPTGTIHGTGGTDVPINFHTDLGFDTYPTFSGKVDWKFTHKNHFYVAISPFWTSRQATLPRTITFEGKTYEAGFVSHSDLHAFLVAPGYQYDIIRRKRGHLAIGVQMDLFNTSAKITGTGTVNGTQQTVIASGSLLAPIPVAGPEFRLYLTNSPRVFLEGNVYGMYFFGYGNFVSTAGTLGVTVSKHISLNAGYQLGSRLNVNGSTDRLGLNLKQKGPIVGMEFSF